MSNEPYLILMVGLPGSGKSTLAKTISYVYDNSVFLSTDKIREDILGDVNDMNNNDKVFKVLYKGIKENIKHGRTTIVDCCNVTIKSRRPIIDIGKKLKCKICAYIVPTLIDECYKRNLLRERKVPENAIRRMYRNFQIPFYKEGLDIIKVLYANEPVGTINMYDIFELCKNFEQNNPNHPENLLSIHQEYVYNNFCKYHKFECACNPDIHDYYMFLFGVYLHDIGKLFTKTTDENGVSHFYSHPNIGSYYLLSTFANMTCGDIYLEIDSILDLCFIPNYHMLPYTWENEKTHKKYKKIFGQNLYNMLIKFNEIDQVTINEKGEVINNGE